MARPGPPRKPRHLRVLEGGKAPPPPDARVLGDDRCGSTDTASGRPCRRRTGGGPCRDHVDDVDGAAAPDFLSPRARAVWLRVERELRALKVLTVLDHGIFASYCIATAGVEETAAHIQSEWVVEGSKGDRKNPHFQILRDCMEKQRMLAKELGLTPASRSAFELPERPEESKMDKLLAGRPG